MVVLFFFGSMKQRLDVLNIHECTQFLKGLFQTCLAVWIRAGRACGFVKMYFLFNQDSIKISSRKWTLLSNTDIRIF